MPFELLLVPKVAQFVKIPTWAWVQVQILSSLSFFMFVLNLQTTFNAESSLGMAILKLKLFFVSFET